MKFSTDGRRVLPALPQGTTALDLPRAEPAPSHRGLRESHLHLRYTIPGECGLAIPRSPGNERIPQKPSAQNGPIDSALAPVAELGLGQTACATRFAYDLSSEGGLRLSLSLLRLETRAMGESGQLGLYSVGSVLDSIGTGTAIGAGILAG